MERFNHLVAKMIPWLTLLMVLLTFLIVILRYVFERNWIWMQESVIYLHAFVFLFAAAYALSRDAHVRVDIDQSLFLCSQWSIYWVPCSY